MEIAELQAGVETDKLVAVAVGMNVSFHFNPSTDLNDAFWAAGQVERRDLVIVSYPAKERSETERWKCIIGLPDNAPAVPRACFDEVVESMAGTPAMAICKAILALKEKP